MLSPFIRANSVYIAEEGELKDLVSQKRQIPKNTKPMKNGKIPTMARITTGKATPKVLLTNV